MEFSGLGVDGCHVLAVPVRFRCQFAPGPREMFRVFSSRGGANRRRPVVSSAASAWRVPAGRAATAGKYVDFHMRPTRERPARRELAEGALNARHGKGFRRGVAQSVLP